MSEDVYLKRLMIHRRKTKSGCWNFTGCLSNGYGMMSYKGVSIGTHRLSWIIHNGDIPSNLLVCHTCDNPRCFNPDHLFLGTNEDNSRDMVSKKRGRSGITKCINGHRFTKKTTYINPSSGKRRCKLCLLIDAGFRNLFIKEGLI